MTHLELAEAIRRRRGELGWTVIQAVAETGISRTTWKDVEAGRRTGLSAPTARRLDTFLDWPAGMTDRVLHGGEQVAPNGDGHTPDSDPEPNLERIAEIVAQLQRDFTDELARSEAEHQRAVRWLRVLRQLPAEAEQTLYEEAVRRSAGPAD